MAKLCYENEGKQVISEHLTCDKGTYRKRYGRQNKTKQIRNMILKFTLAVASHIYAVGLPFFQNKSQFNSLWISYMHIHFMIHDCFTKIFITIKYLNIPIHAVHCTRYSLCVARFVGISIIFHVFGQIENYNIKKNAENKTGNL